MTEEMTIPTTNTMRHWVINSSRRIGCHPAKAQATLLRLVVVLQRVAGAVHLLPLTIRRLITLMRYLKSIAQMWRGSFSSF